MGGGIDRRPVGNQQEYEQGGPEGPPFFVRPINKAMIRRFLSALILGLFWSAHAADLNVGERLAVLVARRHPPGWLQQARPTVC